MNQLNQIKTLDVPIITKLTELFKINYNLVIKFPKFSKNILGERILNEINNILELVFETTIATKYEKQKFLLRAQAKNEMLKILIRICHQNNLFDQKQYLEIQDILQETGKMISGWLKYERNK